MNDTGADTDSGDDADPPGCVRPAATAPSTAPGPGAWSAHAGDLMMVLSAVASSLRPTRTLLRDWLTAHRWPVPAAEDIELAVTEAISNVIDHAYAPDAPGTVSLHAWVCLDSLTRIRRVVVAVTDHGRWAAYHPDSVPAHTGGRGLTVMSGCMAEMHIQRSNSGTTIILKSATAATDAVPAPPVSL